MNAASNHVCTVGDAVIAPGAALDVFAMQCHGAGAIVCFTGLVRGQSAHNDAVTGLTLTAYRGVTLASIRAIATDALARFDITHVRIAHRIGTMAPGEIVVFAAAASSHRRAAFDGADYMMDRLKTDAVLWKQESGPGGPRWIEPGPGDADDRARWETI